MGREVLEACLPWLGLLAVAVVCAFVLMRLSRARLRWRRLAALHRDQRGSAQALSFVLTLPLFVMVLLLIVQVSQLMIGTVIVHYAAYATARSAVVWVPANLGAPEQENCISSYYPDPEAPDQVVPILDPDSPNYGPADGGMTFIIAPSGPKYQKIASAAALACMPICPSRDLGIGLPGSSPMAAEILKSVYGTMVPDAGSNGRIPARLENKLAYALKHTQVELRFFHKNREPPLVTYFKSPDPGEFYFNELGWQDLITVTVKHELALLPGPGRLLARAVVGPSGGRDEVSDTIQQKDGVYVYPLEASITLGNEGQKSVLPYVHSIY